MHRVAAGMLLCALATTSAVAPAAGDRPGALTATVKDESGNAVPDAVLSLTSAGAPATVPPGARAIMDQRDKQFVPRVLPVVVGTAVSFPNRDSQSSWPRSSGRNAFGVAR